MLAAGTEEEDMAVAADKPRTAVDRTEVARTAHLKVDNHPAVGSATEDCLDSWNKVVDRSCVWFLSKFN